MNYVFFGTPEFAAIILEKLINVGLLPQAIVCNPDKPVGRKKIVTPPPTKLVIRNQKIEDRIKILQPEDLDFKFQILNSKFDFFIVAAYAKILPKGILNIPRLGTIGVHPSLLPKYRGPTPIQTAILNGDEETGASLFLLDEEIDHGPILAKRKLNYELRIMNYGELSKKLAELGADLLIQFLRKYENVQKYEKIEGVPQDESQATYTKKFSNQDAYIEPKNLEKAQGSTGSSQETRRLAVEIERKIRALNPEPGTWTRAYEKRVKLLEAKIIDGWLKITKIQVEGGKPQLIENRK